MTLLPTAMDIPAVDGNIAPILHGALTPYRRARIPTLNALREELFDVAARTDMFRPAELGAFIEALLPDAFAADEDFVAEVETMAL